MDNNGKSLPIKRKKDDDDNSDDIEYQERCRKTRDQINKSKIIFPRFLMMMSGDDEKSLSRLSTFAIQKGIQGLVGEPKTIKRLRSGDLLIEVDRESHSTKLLKITELANVPVKVSPHRTLNTSKGVLRTPELKNTTREELIDQLKQQGVTDARMVTIKKNDVIIKVNTAILTFNRPTPPATIKVGFERCNVQPYVPSPLRCFKCQQFGHHQDSCKREKVCGRCAQPDHQDTGCTTKAKCANCNGNHPAFSKDCPRWITEKEIQRVRTEQKISFPEARKIVEVVNKQPSYASVVAKQVVSVGCQTDAVEIRSATGATNASATPGTSSAKTNTSTSPTKKQPVINKKTNVATTTTATPTAPKPLANRDAKQTKNGKTNNKDKNKEIVNKPPVAELTKQINKKNTNKGSGRMPKGTDDPIATYNRYESMDCVDGDESSDSEVFVSPDTVAALQAKIKPGRHKNS